MSAPTIDRMLVRELVENWVVWRDAGDWSRFRTCWHDDGIMMATWFQGPAEDFIRVTKEGWERGVSILHFQGGSAIVAMPHKPRPNAAKRSFCVRAQGSHTRRSPSWARRRPPARRLGHRW